MRPADLRDATWAEVQEHLSEDMRRVHAAWLAHGPGTTRQVAEKSGISLLTLRPRTTDLYQVGLVALMGRSGTEGIYSHVDLEDAAAAWTGNPFDESAPPASADLERQINTLPIKDQLSIAAGIMSRARASKHQRQTDAATGQLGLIL